jgi:hypothetical protein
MWPIVEVYSKQRLFSPSYHPAVIGDIQDLHLCPYIVLDHTKVGKFVYRRRRAEAHGLMWGYSGSEMVAHCEVI